eukprot:2248213-Rhodomonas_salina.1
MIGGEVALLAGFGQTTVYIYPNASSCFVSVGCFALAFPGCREKREAQGGKGKARVTGSVGGVNRGAVALMISATKGVKLVRAAQVV